LSTELAAAVSEPKHVALISTDYPPLRTSAAVQIRDLAVAMCRAGHSTVVIVPTVDLPEVWTTETVDGVVLLRIRAPKTKDIGYVQRTLNEFSLPFLMLLRSRKTPFARVRWDVVAWYSPTIFFGPLVWYLKLISGCRTYLILRDIFPEWTLDLGLMRKGLAYAFFKTVAQIQYSVADVIGVQTESNLAYLDSRRRRTGKRVEVLHNWQEPALNVGSTINVGSTPLAGRRIAVYIGNMGVAQGMDVLVDLAESLAHREDVGFLFVGRGSEVARLKGKIKAGGLNNILFFDEVDSREMPGLLSQCFIGLLSLDPRHKTHNIPGKFLTYLHAGLPVLACVNQGTDLMRLIIDENVGQAFASSSPEPLRVFVERLIDNAAERELMSQNGLNLAKKMFSSRKAADQITASLFEKDEYDSERRVSTKSIG
jgi:glycosyltransferase involved in cell wall biosynthesis